MPNDNSNFKNDWTLMFFFASDNPLAPLLVSQLKAIKDAGFQEHTEVLVYFDPMEKGCPTEIYNVNSRRKAYALKQWKKDRAYPKSSIGDGNDSYIRKMKGDEVNSRYFSPAMRKAMANPSQTPADEMLGYFIDYALTNHKARNYMLFLCGHGLMVGRDMFLPDDDPVSAISLEQLQKIMRRFKQGKTTPLQLLSLHSCSMSSIEVAYQLRGTANYVMAHQGPAFANSWPYRQLLKKILNTIEREKRGAEGRERQDEEAITNRQIDVERLVEKLYYHCLHNATDFLSAGYSADLALCSLQENKLSRIKKPLQNLVGRLKENLYAKSPIMDLILLAHWESQSFWEENHTDLYDFCLCLRKRCNDMQSTLATVRVTRGKLVTALGDVKNACDEVIKVLSIIKSPERSERFKGLVIHADNFGNKYQYARGLSVYFPWCEPLDDDEPPIRPNDETRPMPTPRNQRITQKYQRYDFNADLGADSWWSFLDLYFKETKRLSRKFEPEEKISDQLREVDLTETNPLVNIAETSFNSGGTLSHRTPEVGTRTPETGASCTCPTIKNYPTTFDKKFPRRKIKEFSITPGALRAFRPEKLDLTEEPLEEDDSDNE